MARTAFASLIVQEAVGKHIEGVGRRGKRRDLREPLLPTAGSSPLCPKFLLKLKSAAEI
jgi:hypothetical protein